jgi:apolipoprotein N-acyltransferase
LNSRGIGALGFVCLIPLFLAIRGAGCFGSRRHAARAVLGLAFGASAYAILCSWVFGYHPAAPFALLFQRGLSSALALVLIGIIIDRQETWGWLHAACLWTAMEAILSSGFTAFPYGILGTSQYLNGAMIQSAAFIGVIGVSFFLAACSSYIAAAIELAFRRPPAKKIRILAFQGAGLALGLLAILAAGLVEGPEVLGKKITVLALQADTAPRKEGVRPAGSYADLVSSLVDAARDSGKLAGTDLIVTPETIFPYGLELNLESEAGGEAPRAARSIMETLGSTGIPVLFGNDEVVAGLKPDGGLGTLHFNASLHIEGGRILRVYRKRRLVPFVEHFPFYALLPWAYEGLERLNRLFWSQGRIATVFTVKGLGIATPICYEDCFGDECADFARAGASLFITMASDAWSNSEAAMRQHLASAVFRTVETGLPMLRVTNNGISCLIDRQGRISSELPPFTRAEGRFEIDLRAPAATPYVRSGYLLPIAFYALSSLALAHALIARAPRPGRGGKKPISAFGADQDLH